MPKIVDAPARRRTIAEAAIRTIGRAGLEGARLRDVARAAGVTTGAVTHYFDGKEAVLEAAQEEIVRRTLDRMGRGGGGEGNGGIDRFVDDAARYLPIDAKRRREWRVWIAFWGRSMSEARLRRVHRRYYQKIVDQMVGPLRALVAGRAEPTADELRTVADVVLAAIDGVGTRATLEARSWPAERQRHTLRSLLRPALASFSTRASEPNEEGSR